MDVRFWPEIGPDSQKKPILGLLTISFQNIFAQYIKKKNLKDVNYILPTILDTTVDCLCAWVSDFGQKMGQIRTKLGKSGILMIGFPNKFAQYEML